MLDLPAATRILYMKILGEELGETGRWYIALPPVLLIGFLIGLFFLAAAGQSRLNMANERLHRSQLREQALNEFAGLMTDAESAQRAGSGPGDEESQRHFHTMRQHVCGPASATA